MRFEHAGPLIAATLLAGCAAHPSPADRLAASETAIAGAFVAGAAEFAPGELMRAQEKLALGRRWIAARDYQPALWLVEQAQIDAELAAVKAATASVHRE